jgi:hypothetical protein
VYLDGAEVGAAALAPAQRHASPPPRAFGHVFCRWLRAGADEPGFDLTEFVSQPAGRKWERIVLRALALGQTVSYAFADAL